MSSAHTTPVKLRCNTVHAKNSAAQLSLKSPCCAFDAVQRLQKGKKDGRACSFVLKSNTALQPFCANAVLKRCSCASALMCSGVAI
jgi:hypothetical protein